MNQNLRYEKYGRIPVSPYVYKPFAGNTVEQAKDLIPNDIKEKIRPVKQDQLEAGLSRFFEGELPSRREMDTIIQYVKENPQETRKRVEEIEQLSARFLNSERQPNIAGMLLLSEIEQAQGSILFDNKLTLSFYRQFRPNNCEKIILSLSEENDLQGNVVLHQLLDFCQMFWISLQSIHQNAPEYWEIEEIDADWEGRPTFTQEMAPLLRESMDNVNNYLLQKHFADTLETINLWGDKEEGMSGSPGGMSDAIIFSHRVLPQSIDLRRRMKIFSGYPIAQELVPIAPGYIGLYTHGNLQKVFLETFISDEDEIVNEDKQLISQNKNESYDWIYDSLNSSEPEEHVSFGLRKLEDLGYLDEDLKHSGDSFYFDLSRINMESLHPTVQSNIRERNFFRLQSIHGHEDQVRALSDDEFQRKLFPTGVMTFSEEYMYKYLSNFSMREKVQKEFGISVAELSFAEQMHFLTYLSSQPEEEFNQVKEFSKKFGVNALRTFLVIGNDPVLREQVYNFSKKNPIKDVSKILETYSSLVNAIDNMDTYLASNFGTEDRAIVTAVTLKILERSKYFLSESVSENSDLGLVIENLERVKDDAVIFSAAFRTLRERGELANIETLRDMSLDTEQASELKQKDTDIKQIRELMEQAYRGTSDEFRKSVMDSFGNSLNNPDSKFYVLRRKDEPIAALRFDDIKNEKGEVTERYFGSFISDSAYGNGKLGEAVFEKAIEAESAKGEPVSAHCNPLSPISQKYIEAGFVATGLEDYAGVPSFSIRLDQKINEKSETKKWKPEQIISAALAQDTETIKTYSVTHPSQLPFDLVNQGFALTRYLKQGNRIYAVFEKLSQAVSSVDSEIVSEDVEKGVA